MVNAAALSEVRVLSSLRVHAWVLLCMASSPAEYLLAAMSTAMGAFPLGGRGTTQQPTPLAEAEHGRSWAATEHGTRRMWLWKFWAMPPLRAD